MDKNWLFAPVWFFFTICIECVAWLIFYFWITIKLSYFRSSCRFLIGSHSEVKTPFFIILTLLKLLQEWLHWCLHLFLQWVHFVPHNPMLHWLLNDHHHPIIYQVMMMIHLKKLINLEICKIWSRRRKTAGKEKTKSI